MVLLQFNGDGSNNLKHLKQRIDGETYARNNKTWVSYFTGDC